ncbi:MAG TPA: RsmE family RNA methyltransferase, partial [Hyphomicrobiales bacterium]|nr:RsmE family RNA methyltransferase [Hyphomicrobiales bacterium]
MIQHRLFVANPLSAGAIIFLSSAQAHYLLRVLRLGQGSSLLVFDGKHGEWRAEIVAARKTSCQIKAVEKIRDQTAPQDVFYAFAPLKQARLDYLVQKAVEMGAALLQPVLTQYTAVTRINLKRMEANAIEAAEQCGILALPQIGQPVRLEALLRDHPSERAIIFCDEGARAAPPLDTL